MHTGKSVCVRKEYHLSTSSGVRAWATARRRVARSVRMCIAGAALGVSDTRHDVASSCLSSEMKPLEWDSRTALLVVMASKGYPEEYEKKTPINGLDAAAAVSPNVQVFHAGTTMDGAQLVSNGGRVLGVAAIADDALQAQTLAYEAVDKVDWPKGFCRRDIGKAAVARIKEGKK